MPGLLSAKSKDENKRWWVLVALSFGLILPMLDYSTVSIAVPTIQESLNANFNNVQWIMGANLTAFAAVLLTAGVMGDLLGRKKNYLLGLLLFAAGSTTAAIADTTTLLIVGHAVSGLGAGFIVANSLAIAVDAFKPKDRSVAIAAWAGISAFALGVGPAIGGLLVENFGWQWVFWVSVPIAVFALVLSLGMIDESRLAVKNKQLDVAGLLLGSAGLVSIMYALIESTSLGWGSFNVISALILSLVFCGVFVLNELKAASPLVDIKLCKDETFTVTNIIGFVVSLCLFGLLLYISFYFQYVLDYSPIRTGLSLLPLTIFVFLFAPAAGMLSGKYSGRWIIGPALIAGAIGCFLFGAFADLSVTYLTIVGPLALIGAGLGLVLSPLTATSLSAVDDKKAGRGAGTAMTIRAVGSAIGVGLLGTLLAHGARNNIPAQLKDSGLPEGADEAVKEIVGTNIVHLDETITSLPKQFSDPIYKAIDQATAFGVARTLYVAGAFLLITAIITMLFLKNKEKSRLAKLAGKVKSVFKR